MDINEIKLKWVSSETNKEANINLWDEKANYFGNYTIPRFEDDKFLQLFKNENLIHKDFKILDVGCGGGKYTIALSKECKEIYGIDLSPKMIEYANSNKDKYNIKNVFFVCDDWHEIDIKKSSFYKSFDLVFASMTPAIQSASTFEKLMEASRKYCVLRCNLKRTDSIYDKIKKELNMNMKEKNATFLYALNMIYLKGYLPKVFYEQKTWLYKETLEKAYNNYIKKAKTEIEIKKEDENKIKKILDNISKDGYIEEKINSTLATIIWSVEL